MPVQSLPLMDLYRCQQNGVRTVTKYVDSLRFQEMQIDKPVYHVIRGMLLRLLVFNKTQSLCYPRR